MFERRAPDDPPPGQLPLPGMGPDGTDGPPFLPEELPGPAARQYLMFAALLPDEASAGLASRLAQQEREIHRLRQPAMALERLHVTVQPIVAFQHAVPRLIVRASLDAIGAAAAGLRAVPVRFDRVGSLGPAAPTALVLLCDTTSQRAIAALRNRLAQALRRHGLHAAPRNTPHMTLVYGTRAVPQRPIEPIGWQACRLVLVLSHQGRGHHQIVGDWPLAE